MLEKISDVLFELKQQYHTSNILLGGDFNLVPNEWLDRSPPRHNVDQWNPIIFDFLNSNSLIDLWRERNLQSTQFSWIKPNGNYKSRIDLWLGTSDIFNCSSDISISTAPLTDHSVLVLQLSPENKPTFKKDYWKLNADLLNCDEFVSTVKGLIKKIYNDVSIGTYMKRWEYLKYKIREFAIAFGKQRIKQQKEYEYKLIQDINSYSIKTSTTEMEKKNFFKFTLSIRLIVQEKSTWSFH